ncbi:hypothetical protein [Ramlibacter albus]|uniref:Uncharacterized protein n=1 Tax=Ramlibacter albus TaxID=2079448 RepID=A0A923M6W2_9BURK|nr:hypothetical protein [Ramlibacter albus]MBC5764008.1 hypothetical protein [Ramlibacter albus]
MFAITEPEGLSLRAKEDGFEFTAGKLEAGSLRVATGPFVLEVARATLDDLVASARLEGGTPRIVALKAANAELSGVKVRGPVVLPDRVGAAPEDWCLDPLATADGTIKAQIVDAHLMFDADVTVPVRRGEVHFNEAKVEHIGPDSRMGVSRMGIYVDAANGRSYLYQFTSSPVAGVQFEQRGALLTPWVSDRGSLRLKEFGEGLLRQGQVGPGIGFTEQARLLLDRTSVTGFLQLGDGKFAVPGVHAELAGRAQQRNVVRVHSEAVGRGITAELAALSARGALLKFKDMQFAADEVGGALTLKLFVENKQVRFEFEAASLKVTGLRLA